MQLTTCLKALALASCFFFYSNASLADPTPASNCAVTTYTGTGSGSAMISNRDGRKYQNTESDTLECTTLDMNGNVGYIVDETMSYDSDGNPVAVYSSTDGSYTFSADTLSNKIIKSTFAINEALQQAGHTSAPNLYSPEQCCPPEPPLSSQHDLSRRRAVAWNLSSHWRLSR